MTEIYLIRHAEAEGNVFRRFQGQYESLLTPRGHRQVECVRRRLEKIHMDACFSSDMTRTSLTARAVYVPRGLPLIRDPRFRETGIGVWEDKPFGWLYRYCSASMDQLNRDPVNWRCEGAETFDECTQRFHEGLMDAARAYDGGTIAVFSHGSVIRNYLMRQFFGVDAQSVPYCDNTGVCRLIYDRGTLSYDYVNDNSHLPYELSTFALQRWWRESGRRDEVNCWFEPYEESMALPAGLKLPHRDSGGITLAAILRDMPIGIISLGQPEGETGRIIGMALPEELDGRMYGDQLLGAAFSHFRGLGCRRLALDPGHYPDDLIDRYEFSGEALSRSIDVNAFDWTK